MQKVIEYADKNNLTLILIAQRYGSPSHKGLDNKQLEAFYGEFGFEIKPPPRKPPSMIRHPSQDLHAI